MAIKNGKNIPDRSPMALPTAGRQAAVNEGRDTPYYAGRDVTVEEGELVELDGSASFDPNGGKPAFAWSQIGGEIDVAQLGADTSTPRFFAPLMSATTAKIRKPVQTALSAEMTSSKPASPATATS